MLGAAACAMAMACEGRDAEIELGCSHMKWLMAMGAIHLQTLEEYKMQGLVLDYDIAPVDTAEIIRSPSFFRSLPLSLRACMHACANTHATHIIDHHIRAAV